MDVPYRCPRCGDGKTFPVLSDLKQHLSVEHSYVPTPRKRVQVFNGKKGGNSGRSSPLLQSFHDENKRLERELQEARDMEMNNKMNRYRDDKSNLIRSVGAEFVKPSMVSFEDGLTRNTLNTFTMDVGQNGRNQLVSTDALIKTSEVLSDVEKAAETKSSEQQSVIEKLNTDLRAKEEDLKNSEEELDRLRKEQGQLIESAEILSRKTNEESQRLSEELEAKEVQLGRINSQLAQLRQNSLEDWAAQQRQGPSWKSEKDAKNMMMERNMLKKREEMLRQSMRADSDQFEARRIQGLQYERREPYQHQGYGRSSFEQPEQEVEELDLLSQELRKMQRDAVQKIQEKDKELIRAKKRSEKLEKDRLVLLHEMENLLSKANTDNEKLKSELKNKDGELKEFNTNLQDAKKEQSKLVGETFELYRQADKNIAKLKEMLTLKDFQLQAANEKLSQFQVANEQLIVESESIALHADEKGNIMETMLQTTEQNLEVMEKELNETKCEKEKLREETENLKQKVAERSRSLAELQQEVQEKEKELEKTNDDLKTLQTFLQTTAVKESVARKELEKFIMELIERADKAEKELRTLKRHMRAASVAKTSDESQSAPSTHIPVSLHNTLTEPVIHNTVPYISSMSQNEGKGSQPVDSTTVTAASSQHKSRSKHSHAAPDARNKQRKSVPHTERPLQMTTPISPRLETSQSVNPVDVHREQSGDTQTVSRPQAFVNERNYQVSSSGIPDGQLVAAGPVPVGSSVGSSFDGPELDHSRRIKDGGSGFQTSEKLNRSTPRLQPEPVETSSLHTGLLKREKKVVSDMAIQTETETALVKEHDPISPCKSESQKPVCSNCQTSIEDMHEDLGRELQSTGIPEPKKQPVNVTERSENINTVQNAKVADIPPEKPPRLKQNQFVCSKCSNVTASEQEEYNELVSVPVPIHSSTPKKSTNPITSEQVCKHCQVSIVDSDSLEPALSKENELHSARAAVLARIMADEAKANNEQRLWQNVDSDPRLRPQPFYSRTDFQPHVRGREAVGLSRQFDRIRHPGTLQYVYSDSPSNSVGFRRLDVHQREQRAPFVNSWRNEPSHDLGAARRSRAEVGSSQSLSKEASQSLSNRLDKLEKVISETRSKSNEGNKQVLDEHTVDSSLISAKEGIQRLRESIKPRLNSKRTKSSQTAVGTSTASGTLGQRDQLRVAGTDTYNLSPQSSDSYIGLPSSTDRLDDLSARERLSPSYSNYRSSEPGLVIRNEFYGLEGQDKPVHSGVQHRAEYKTSNSKPQPVTSRFTNAEFSSNMPVKGRDVDGHFYSQTHSPQQYFQNRSSQYYEHFPQRMYPVEIPVYTQHGHYSQSDRMLQSIPSHLTNAKQYLWTGAPNRKQMESSDRGYLFGREGKETYHEEPRKKMVSGLDSLDISTDSDMSAGLELSVDENGILWDEEQADTTGLSEDLDSFRPSPSGSETAGDVDSSLLLSGSGSQTAPGKADSHRQVLEEIVETDEESSYCGLPGEAAHKGQGHVQNRSDKTGHGYVQSGRGDAGFRDGTTGVRSEGRRLKTNQGGMVSDIVSVRDKMMKFLDEDDLKGRRTRSDGAGSYRNVGYKSTKERPRNAGTDHNDGKTEELNNSSSVSQQMRHVPLAEISSDLIHNRLESPKGSKSASIGNSDDDHSSSSYTPIKPSGSKSKIIRTDSFDLDVDNMIESQSGVKSRINDTGERGVKPKRSSLVSQSGRDTIARQEVLEEPIQPQSKTPASMSTEISRKLNLMSSSSESLDQLPRRKPVAKKRNMNVDKTDDTCFQDSPDGGGVQQPKDSIQSQTVVKADVHAGLEPSLARNVPSVKQEHFQPEADLLRDDGNKKSFESFDNRDSVLGTSIGSDPIDDMARYEHTAQRDFKDGVTHGKEESGLTSSLDSLDDLAKYDSVPLKKAQPLHPTFADEATTDDERSRESLLGNQDASPAVLKEESTDFDFESDLERFSTPLTISKSSRKKKNKVFTHKKARGGPSGRRLSIPKSHLDESSDAASDVSKLSRRHEAAKRRRVALFCVFRYLDIRTLSRMALVCREWRHVCRHPELWKKVELKNERISSSFLVTISQWCSRLQHLTLEGLQARQRQSNESLDEYQQNIRASIEPGLEELLKCCQDSLTSLQIIACGNLLTNKCLWLASCYCRLLETLHYVSSTDPVTAEVLWAIGGGCPGVTKLVIPPLIPCVKPKSFTNKCLLLIAKFYPDLLELGIGGQEISIGGLLPLVQGCQRLQYLELDHLPEMTSDDVTALCRAGLRNLSVLELNATPIAPDAVKQIYKSCRHLKRLRVLLNFHDFFEDVNKKKNREEYKKRIQKLQDLLKQPGLGNVLKIHAAPIE